jgi:hypothetical protein
MELHFVLIDEVHVLLFQAEIVPAEVNAWLALVSFSKVGGPHLIMLLDGGNEDGAPNIEYFSHTP